MKSSSSSSSTSTCSSTISQDLSASYQNQQDFGYQDAMGKLLNDYVKVIPGGILMFFPSYALMLKLVQRWKMTKQWFSIQKTKEIFMEPRQTGKEFDLILEKYKKTILNPITNGAIMLAVYRGKVSEGIDFSNENARAVLAVGIPYPNVKELQVQLKRQYQDTKSQIDRKLVNGTSWYQLQAFRALNQALGRCIRHREDYGVILLIDSRHRQGIHVRHLSKWIRPHVQEFTQASKSVQEVQHFFQRIEKTHFFSKRQQFLAAAATTTTTTTAAAAAITIETNTKPIELKYETTTPTMSTTTIPSSSSPMGMSVNSYMAATAVSKAKARKKNIHNTNAKSQYFSIFQKKN
jgi:Fanconi anemia group J protein